MQPTGKPSDPVYPGSIKIGIAGGAVAPALC